MGGAARDITAAPPATRATPTYSGGHRAAKSPTHCKFFRVCECGGAHKQSQRNKTAGRGWPFQAQGAHKPQNLSHSRKNVHDSRPKPARNPRSALAPYAIHSTRPDAMS